jgi:hypothetical protein
MRTGMKTHGKQQPRKTKDKPIREQQQVRMKEALKDRIRRYQQQVIEETGLEVNFSSAVRSLIEKALDAANVP